MNGEKGRKKERKEGRVSAEERFFPTKPTHKCNNIISWIQFFSSFIFILFLSTFFFLSSLSYSEKKEKKKRERKRKSTGNFWHGSLTLLQDIFWSRKNSFHEMFSLSPANFFIHFRSFSCSLRLSPSFSSSFLPSSPKKEMKVKMWRRKKNKVLWVDTNGHYNKSEWVSSSLVIPFFPFLLFFLFLFLLSFFSSFSFFSLISSSSLSNFSCSEEEGRRVFLGPENTGKKSGLDGMWRKWKRKRRKK